MSKLVLILALSFGFQSIIAQETTKIEEAAFTFLDFGSNPNPPEMPSLGVLAEKEESEKLNMINWNQTTHNFGTIDINKPVKSEFVLTNSGETPLIIEDAKGSCGCTGTDFPKDAILPGESAIITATYDAKNLGPFKKTVKVKTNASKEEIVLYVEGEVVWKF